MPVRDFLSMTAALLPLVLLDFLVRVERLAFPIARGFLASSKRFSIRLTTRSKRTIGHASPGWNFPSGKFVPRTEQPVTLA